MEREQSRAPGEDEVVRKMSRGAACWLACCVVLVEEKEGSHPAEMECSTVGLGV